MLLASAQRCSHNFSVPRNSTRPSLLSRLRDPQDAAAWHEFDAQYRDLMRRYCARRGLQVADAEDVCQVVMLAMMRVLPGFHLDPARGRFRSYLGRAVHNAICQRQKRDGRAQPALEDAVLEVLAASNEEPVGAAWDEEWSNHHLRRAMQTLRSQLEPASLAAFERLLKGESPEQVAQALGMTVEGVHKIKQRVGERLRAEVERQVREEDSPGNAGA